jgi:HK97 family phage major capsid protein
MDVMLSRAIAQAFAKEIDRASLRGSGTLPEIKGLLNISGVNSVTNGAAGTSLTTIKWSNLLSAYQAILEASAPVPTAAIMAPRTLTGFAALADTVGQPLERPSLLDPMQFIATSQVPTNLTVGASTDCTELFCGAFENLLIGMRENVTVLRAAELHAATGEVGFYCHVRLDVGVTHAAAFAVVTGIRP